MSKRAVVVVDIQNDYFPGGEFELVGIDKAAANAARVIEAARMMSALGFACATITDAGAYTTQ